jgi:hypothetical protein
MHSHGLVPRPVVIGLLAAINAPKLVTPEYGRDYDVFAKVAETAESIELFGLNLLPCPLAFLCMAETFPLAVNMQRATVQDVVFPSSHATFRGGKAISLPYQTRQRMFRPVLCLVARSAESLTIVEFVRVAPTVYVFLSVNV